MRPVDLARRLGSWLYLQFGAAYFRVVAVGGSAAVVFLTIWPLSTVIVVVLVTTLTPVIARRRTARSVRKATSMDTATPSS